MHPSPPAAPTRVPTDTTARAPGASRLLLLAHGSRRAQWASPFEQLRELLRARDAALDVELCFLESMTPLLPQALDEAAACGRAAVLVVPMFLGNGAHLARDVEQQLRAARKRHPAMRIELGAAAGDSPIVLRALAEHALQCLLRGDGRAPA